MKKRLISMLLAVLLVATMFGGTSISAYADSDYNTFKYTIVSGDTLLQICNNSGLNFYTCQTAINKLNNFTSEAQYRKLYVGQVITLPASNEDAAKIASSYVSGGTGSSAGSISGSTGNVSGNVAYWLIPYTIQSGETITGVCNTLGISFSSYADLIKSINNISSWNRIPAGKTLLLPTAVKPAAGISCYAVMAHKVTQGETTYGICQNYGISYTSNTSLLQTLNPKVSLTNIKYNTTLLVPVPTVITAGGSNNGGSTSGGNNNGGSTSGGSNNGGSTSGGGNTGSSTKTYAIKSSTSGGGSLSFTVNGKTATAAAAGATVTIKSNPEAYKTLENIRVVYADNSAVLPVSNGTFTMPECNVRVEATFGTGYLVGPAVTGSGSLSCTVNNVPVTHAVKGATVKVNATPSSGYTLSDITVKNFSGKVIASGLSNGSTFTMPGEKVLVYVTFKSVATYGFSKSTDGNGSFVLKVKGAEVTSAAAGATVDVVASPYSGYGVDKITVTNKSNGTSFEATNNSFTMPASDVEVYVTFTGAKYSVTVDNSQKGGTVSASPSNAKPGETVTLTASPYAGYAIDYYTIKYGDTTKRVEVSDPTFKMPSESVTVTPVFRTRATVLTINNTDASIATVTVRDSNGNVVNSGGNVQTWSNYSLETQVLKSGYDVVISVNGQKVTGNSFTTDGSGSIEVKVEYTRKEYTLTVENNWIGFFELVVNSNATKITSSGQKITVPTGTTVTAQLLAEYKDNYEIVGIELDGKAYNGQNWVEMPGGNATLKVLIEDTTASTNAEADVGGFDLGV